MLLDGRRTIYSLIMRRYTLLRDSFCRGIRLSRHGVVRMHRCSCHAHAVDQQGNDQEQLQQDGTSMHGAIMRKG